MALLVASCGQASPPGPAPIPAQFARATVRPGDAVLVQAWREDDISGQYPVDDRGVITLPLLGEREVAGLDPAELHDRLIAEYREYLQNPSVSVTVLRRITILGAVGQPGLYHVDATISLSEALGMAGGITSAGNANDIRVMRGEAVVQSGLDQALVLGVVDIRSGDRIVVGEKNWIARNSGALLGSVVGAAAGITIALIR
ncbi:MAG TPA: polysaccharide biosynthesis/export family protein [Longimicrobiaceae bacterium]|nr:polysaccharide biosynthesis/export family protein [Longimicrobiaceae bacterium]